MACDKHGTESDLLDNKGKPTGQKICLQCLYGAPPPVAASRLPSGTVTVVLEEAVEPPAATVEKKSSRRS